MRSTPSTGRLRRGVHAVLGASHHSGLTAALAGSWQQGLTVLCYHRLAESVTADFQGFRTNISATTASFERQVAYLCQHFSPISIGDLCAYLDGAGHLPRRPALVTFDDGYRDNGELAWPILRRNGVPALIFLATDHIGTGRPFLWDFAAFCFHETRRVRADVPLLGSVSLATAEARERATLIWVHAAKALDADARWTVADRLAESLDVTRRDARLGDLTLTWDDVRRLGEEGVQFGGHTCSHPILTRMPAASALAEIAQSRARIASAVGTPPLAFAYPNGAAGDFAPEHERAVSEAGYRVAFSMRPGPASLAGIRRRPTAIRRIYVGLDDDMPRFAAKLAGAARLQALFH